MNDKQTKLIQSAKTICGELQLPNEFSAGTVGAAILTASGAIYTGVCIDLACGLGFCAEAAAIAEMLKHRETHILSIVAVAEDGTILPPCGRCREMIAQVNSANLDAQILLEGERVLPLKKLLPEHWIEYIKT